MEIKDPLELSKSIYTEENEKSLLTLKDNLYKGNFTCTFVHEYQEFGKRGLFYRTFDLTFPIVGVMIENDEKYKFPYLDLDFNYELDEDFRDELDIDKKLEMDTYTKTCGSGRMFLINDNTFIGFGKDLGIQTIPGTDPFFNNKVHYKEKMNHDHFYLSLDKKKEEELKRITGFSPDPYSEKLEDIKIDILIGKVESRTNSFIEKISIQFVYNFYNRLEYIYEVTKYLDSLKTNHSNPNRNPL